MDNPRRAPKGNRGGRATRPAFTLIETSMALVIIGVGVLAFIDAQNAFIKNNSWSSQAATASLLASEIRELTRRFPRHDPVNSLYLQGTGSSAVLVGWGPEIGEVTAADLDDIDDLDGLRFGDDGDMPGPINAYGDIVAQTDADGNLVTDENGVPVSMRGWSQTVLVEKVDVFNYSLNRPREYVEAPSGSFPGRTVEQYPLRVTVTVDYTGPNDTSPREIARMVWVVP